MLVCCSSPYCTQHSVSWATGSMDRLRMKVLPWIYPAQTCMLSRIIPLQTHWAHHSIEYVSFCVFSITKIVQAVFTVATFISYGLQCYVPVEIIWTNYLSKRFGGKLKWEFVVRVTIVLITCEWRSSIVRPAELILTFSYPVFSCAGHYGASFSVIHFTCWRNVFVDVGYHLPRYYGDLRTLAGQIGPIQHGCLAQCVAHHHWFCWIDLWNW